MEKLRIIFGLAALSILACACVNEVELPVPEQESRLTAVIEGSPETRTTLSPESYGVSKVLWSEGDCIGVFIDGSETANPFALVEGAGTGNAVFSGYGSGSEYLAIYPYSMISRIEGRNVSVTLPYEQDYAGETFQSGSYPMAAVSDSPDLRFRNLCSVLKVSMTGRHVVTRLVFRSNDSGVKVTGPATVSLADPSNPVLTMSGDGCDSLVVNTGEVVVGDSQKDFFMVLPAQKYKGGFTVRVYTTEGYMDKVLSSDFTMERARKHDAKPFAIKLDVGVDPSEALAGHGTEDDPFLIGSASDLLLMRESINAGALIKTLTGDEIEAFSASYLMTADIDMSQLCGKGGKNWVPIGSPSFSGGTPFSGTFDGGGHEISNLYINNYLTYQGLFGSINGTVRNLTVSGEISCIGSSGLLAGSAYSPSKVENCVSKGSVTGWDDMGGLVGLAYDEMTYCRNEAEIQGNLFVGGIAGLCYFTDKIIHCTNAGNVTGRESVGGISGYFNTSYALDCTNYGDVEGSERVGGIGGSFRQGGSALNCANYGEVKGDECVGGIGGLLSSQYSIYTNATTIANCINLGTVVFNGGAFGGFLAGYIGLFEGEVPEPDEPADNAWVMNSYWLQGCGRGVTSAAGGGPGIAKDDLALTDAQFKGAAYDGALYTDLEGNSFDLLIDALNAGAVYWGRKLNKSLSGWEDLSAGSYPVQTDLAAQMPGDSKQVFEADRNVFEFNVCAGEFQVTVTSSHDYSLTGLPDWIAQTSVESLPNKPHTKVHTFAVKANDTGKLRKCTFDFVNSEGKTLRIRVSQKEPYLSVSETELSFFSAGGSKTIVVTSSMEWKTAVGEQNDWYSVTPEDGYGDGSVILTVRENTGSAARGGFITIASKDGSVSYKVSFVQSGLSGEENDDWKELPFYHQSLIMRFTATWCTWCPFMGAAISRAQELYPGKIQHLALHGSGSDLEFGPTSNLFNFYQASGYPSGVVDGRAGVDNNTDLEPAAANFVRLCKETEETYGTTTGIAIRSTAAGQKVSVDVTGYFKEAGEYMITVLLVEDGIVNYQENGGKDYVHNGVARVSATNIRGEGFTVAKALSKRDFHYDVNVPMVCKPENMRVLAYIHRPFGTMPRKQTGNFGDFFIDNCASAQVGDVLKVALVGETGGDGEGEGNEGVTPGGEIK